MPDRVISLLRIRVSTPLWLYLIMWILIMVSVIRVENSIRNQHRLIKGNRVLLIRAQHTDTRIQSSRLKSCKATYQSFPDMFQVFFPKDRRKWTEVEKLNWDKLNRRASFLARTRCVGQVKIK